MLFYLQYLLMYNQAYIFYSPLHLSLFLTLSFSLFFSLSPLILRPCIALYCKDFAVTKNEQVLFSSFVLIVGFPKVLKHISCNRFEIRHFSHALVNMLVLLKYAYLILLSNIGSCFSIRCHLMLAFVH